MPQDEGVESVQRPRTQSPKKVRKTGVLVGKLLAQQNRELQEKIKKQQEEMGKHREDMERQQGMLKELQMRLDAFTSLRQQQPTTDDVGSDEEEEGEYAEDEGEDSLGTGEILGEVVDASKGSPPAAAKKPKEKRNINDRIDWSKRLGTDDLVENMAPLVESSWSDEDSFSDSDDDSSDNSSSESEDEKKKKKKKKKEKKELERKRIFKEPMGSKRKIRDLSSLSKGGDMEQDMMIQRSLSNEYSPAGAHFLMKVYKLRQQATLNKAYLYRMKTTRNASMQLIKKAYESAADHANELFTLYCMLDHYYGEFGQNFQKLQQFLMEVYTTRTRLERTSFGDKLIKKVHKKFEDKTRLTGQRSVQKVSAKVKAAKTAYNGTGKNDYMANSQCNACGQMGHKAFMRACPKHAQHDPNWKPKIGTRRKK